MGAPRALECTLDLHRAIHRAIMDRDADLARSTTLPRLATTSPRSPRPRSRWRSRQGTASSPATRTTPNRSLSAILDWDDVRTAENPRAAAVEFAHSAFRHACLACEWSTDLLGSTEGRPPPLR